MKALVFDKSVQFIDHSPVPVRGKGEALIRVLLAGICQTDIEITKGYMDFTGIMGHEFVGLVEECDEGKWIGKRVVGEINCACGVCEICRKGLRRHCPDRTVLGILGRDGAFAEYVVLPIENLHMVPDAIRDDEAVFIEPLAAAYRILEQAAITPTERVIVLGDGKLGLLVCQVLQRTNCDLLLIGNHQSKLNIVRKMGVKTARHNEYSGAPADVVVECTGSPKGFMTALDVLRPLGTMILKSTFVETKNLDTAPIVINEITVIGSRCGPFNSAIESLADKRVSVQPLITKTMPLDQGLQAIDIASRKESMKILLNVTATVH